MASMSDYLENKLIDQIWRGTAYTFPGTVYFALYTVNPTDTGGGTEVSGGSYARVTMACNGTNFANTQASGTGVSTGTSGVTSNSVAITFPSPTADWGRVTGIAVLDAASTGNFLFWGALTTPKNVNNGDPAPFFPIGSFTYNVDA